MEIEAKIKVEAHEPVRARLRELGAVRVGRYREVNHIFDQRALGLRESGQALRVRELDTLEGQTRPATITYKGPVDRSATYKTRPEVEISTVSPQRAVELFEALGFTCELIFEKNRETWSYRNCKVELDELPKLGPFIEIEGPDSDSIQRALSELGVQDGHVPRSYVGMLLSYCRAAGVPERVIRF